MRSWFSKGRRISKIIVRSTRGVPGGGPCKRNRPRGSLNGRGLSLAKWKPWSVRKRRVWVGITMGTMDTGESLHADEMQRHSSRWCALGTKIFRLDSTEGTLPDERCHTREQGNFLENVLTFFFLLFLFSTRSFYVLRVKEYRANNRIYDRLKISRSRPSLFPRLLEMRFDPIRRRQFMQICYDHHISPSRLSVLCLRILLCFVTREIELSVNQSLPLITNRI